MAPEDLLPLAPWLLAAIVWMLALAVAQRHLWPALGLEAFDAGWSTGPESLTPIGDDELYDSFYEQLLALGFKPAGTTWEQVRGKQRIESRAFLHPREAWRASAWRALGGHYRIYFVTQFANGGAVLSANYSRPVTKGTNYLAHGLPTTDLALLLKLHQETVACLVNAGNKPERCVSLDDIARAKRAYHGMPAVNRVYRRNEWSNFRTRLVSVGLLPTSLALFLINRGNPAEYAWLAALALSVGMLIFLTLAKSDLLRRMTAEQQNADRLRKGKNLGDA